MAADDTPRDRLLDAAVDYVAAHGTHDLSLRALAAGIGTSHRMLSYHFGSREGLLVAIARRVEADQRAVLAALAADPATDPLEAMLAMHDRFADPALAPQERLFFDLYVRALHGREDAAPLLEGDVEAWVRTAAPLFERLGFGPADARAQARLALAVSRGLLLDLLATGDRAGVEAAARAWAASLPAR